MKEFGHKLAKVVRCLFVIIVGGVKFSVVLVESMDFLVGKVNSFEGGIIEISSLP